MRLPARVYALLRKARGHTLPVTFTVVSSLGTYTRAIAITA